MSVLEKFETKTEKEIVNIFFTLMEEENFERVSVSRIAQYAEISRGTFYMYFENKYDLVESVENKIFEEFINIMEKIRNGGMKKYYVSIEQGYNYDFLEYFDCLEENFAYFKVMFSDNYVGGFSSRLTKVFMRERLKTSNIWRRKKYQMNNINSLSRKYREEILSSLYTTIFKTWINNNMDMSKEELVTLLTKMWQPLEKL